MSQTEFQITVKEFVVIILAWIISITGILWIVKTFFPSVWQNYLDFTKALIEFIKEAFKHV